MSVKRNGLLSKSQRGEMGAGKGRLKSHGQNVKTRKCIIASHDKNCVPDRLASRKAIPFYDGKEVEGHRGSGSS